MQSAKSTPCVTGPEKPNIWTQPLVVRIFLPGAALSLPAGGAVARPGRGLLQERPGRAGTAQVRRAGIPHSPPGTGRAGLGSALSPPERENL